MRLVVLINLNNLHINILLESGKQNSSRRLYKVPAKTVRDIWTHKTWSSATCNLSNTLRHDTTGARFEVGTESAFVLSAPTNCAELR